MTRKLVVGKVPRKVRPPTTVRPPTEGGSSPTLGPLVTALDGQADPYTHSYPSGIVSGDLILLVTFGNGGGGSAATQTHTATGFTQRDSDYRTPQDDSRLTVFYRIADGSEAGTNTTITSDSDNPGFGSVMWYVKANGVDFSSVLPDVIIDQGTYDTPEITVSHGAADYLIFPVFGWISSDLDAAPSGYTFLRSDDPTTGKEFDQRVSVASKLVSVTTTDDPGTWTFSNTAGQQSMIATIAVKVAASDPAVVGYPVTASDIDAESSTDGQVLTSDGAGNAAWEDVPAGVTDHGALTGLADDDHNQYTLADGSRAFSGDQSLGSNKLTNVTDPTSAQDAATKAYVDANVGSELLVPDVLENPVARFTATAAQTIADTTTETTLFGSGEGTLTFPANFFQAGEVTFVTMRGQLSDTGTPNFTIKMKLGSTTICSVGPTALTGISGVEWQMELMFTCRTVGASGSFVGGGLFDYDDGSELSLSSGTPVSIDTTAAQVLDVTWEWGTADASNTITTQEAYVDSHDPNRVVNDALGPLTNEDEDDFLYSDAL